MLPSPSPADPAEFEFSPLIDTAIAGLDSYPGLARCGCTVGFCGSRVWLANVLVIRGLGIVRTSSADGCLIWRSPTRQSPERAGTRAIVRPKTCIYTPQPVITKRRNGLVLSIAGSARIVEVVPVWNDSRYEQVF